MEATSKYLMEGIGLALEVSGDRMFMSDLGGSLCTASLDGDVQEAARCSGESDRRRLRRLICSSQHISHSRSGWHNKKKKSGGIYVRSTNSGSKEAEGTTEAQQRFLPDLSDAV
jgi:hypothetical protein